jgi:hypothetical protein
LVVLDEMKSVPVPRNVFILCGMNPANGIRVINVQRYGTFTTAI